MQIMSLVENVLDIIHLKKKCLGSSENQIEHDLIKINHIFCVSCEPNIPFNNEYCTN